LALCGIAIAIEVTDTVRVFTDRPALPVELFLNAIVRVREKAQ
jgi:hypothetical protein